MTYQEAALGGTVATLGPVIHNPFVTRDLEEKGVRSYDTVAEIPDGARVIIRAHGVPPEIYRQLENRGLQWKDATCPFVQKIHRLVAQQPEGTMILLAGDPTHPEVVGIAGIAISPVSSSRQRKN